MSGRDFKTFLASHQTEIGKDNTRLVTRFLSGGKPTYKQNDYNKLYALTQIKQSSGDRALKKIEILSQKGKDYKERQLLHEHKRIWEKELHKLKHAQDKIENELLLLRPPPSNFQQSTTSLEELYEDIIDFDDSLKIELHQFTKQTLQPVIDLQNDLQNWVNENRRQLVLGVHNEENENEVYDVLDSVKQQQSNVLKQLTMDEQIMEDEFYRFIEQIGLNLHDVKLPQITISIPEHILTMECPDESLRISCLQNFDSLDEKYSAQVEQLEEKYENAIRRSTYGDWSEHDHLHFKHIMGQYQDLTKNRRKLYMHRFTKDMSHKTREQLVSHEEWWFQYKSFQAQLKDLFHAWKRDKDDLVLRVTWLFKEACQQYAEKHQKMIDHMSQKFVCNYLHEKLLEYQTEKLELMKLESAYRAQQEEEQEKKRKEREIREKAKRKFDKEKIQTYKANQDLLLSKQREYDRRRMIELQERQAEQRAYDMERVYYREELNIDKLENKKQQKHMQEIENIRKEERLQALRDQVIKNVEDNPQRIFEPTQAYKARVAVTDDDELEAQTPLFTMYTYSVDQVAQDKRLKIENALRRANLHMTDYARKLLSDVAPPTQPRKDTLSTAFKINTS